MKKLWYFRAVKHKERAEADLVGSIPWHRDMDPNLHTVIYSNLWYGIQDNYQFYKL